MKLECAGCGQDRHIMQLCLEAVLENVLSNDKLIGTEGREYSLTACSLGRFQQENRRTMFGHPLLCKIPHAGAIQHVGPLGVSSRMNKG